jgi:hypothetical protein
MDFFFYGMSSINGYDSYGHYLRAGLILNACSQYAITPLPDCLSNFGSSSESSARAASARTPAYADTRRSDSLRELDAFFHGKKLDLGGDSTPAATRSRPAARSTQRAPESRPAARNALRATAPSDAQQSLLDYLLGGDG